MVRIRRRNILVGLGTIVFGTSGFIASGAFELGSEGSAGDNWVQVASAQQTVEADDQSVTGDQVEATEASLAVETRAATDVSGSSVTLNGELTGLGEYDEATVYFEWGKSTDSLPYTTGRQTVDATGTFDDVVVNIEPGVEYEFRAVVQTSDDFDKGTTRTFRIDAGEVAVETRAATDVDGSSATLNGDLTALGEYDGATVYFEWGQRGEGLPNTTSEQSLDETGTFTENVTDLELDTKYEFRAVAEASSDSAVSDEGRTLTFEITEDDIAVETRAATAVSESSATLNGDLTALGGYDGATVYFEWGQSGVGLPNTTSEQSLDETGTFDETVLNIEAGVEYEFRAVAEADDDTDVGATLTFELESETDGVDAERTDSLVQIVADPDNGGNHVSTGEIDWLSDARITGSELVVSDDDGLFEAFSVENANKEAVSRVGLVDENGHPQDRVAFLVANVGNSDTPGEGGVTVDISMELHDGDVNSVDPADILNFPFRTVTTNGNVPASGRGTDLLATTVALPVSDILEVVIEIDSRSTDHRYDLPQIVAAVEAVDELVVTAEDTNG